LVPVSQGAQQGRLKFLPCKANQSMENSFEQTSSMEDVSAIIYFIIDNLLCHYTLFMWKTGHDEWNT